MGGRRVKALAASSKAAGSSGGGGEAQWGLRRARRLGDLAALGEKLRALIGELNDLVEQWARVGVKADGEVSGVAGEPCRRVGAKLDEQARELGVIGLNREGERAVVMGGDRRVGSGEKQGVGAGFAFAVRPGLDGVGAPQGSGEGGVAVGGSGVQIGSGVDKGFKGVEARVGGGADQGGEAWGKPAEVLLDASRAQVGSGVNERSDGVIAAEGDGVINDRVVAWRVEVWVRAAREEGEETIGQGV